MRARGVRPWSLSACSDTISTADAPSQIWLALAADSTPVSEIGFTPAMPSSVASKRMPSSTLCHSLPSGVSISTGTISLSNAPAWVAAAARQHDVLRAAHHRLRSELHRLLRRTALAIDGDGRNAVGQLRGENGVAAQIHRLLAALHHAAGNDVIDRLGIEIVARRDCVEHRCAQIDRVDTGETAAATATSGANRIYDICMSHRASPCRMREATIRRADSAMDLIERLNRVGAYVNGKSTGMPPPSSSPPRKRGSR